MIAGHRGAAARAPENTFSGFEKALQSGAKWVETDTQLSADNIPVIFHDQRVNRCTNGKGKVADLTVAQLQALDAGSWFSEDFKGEKIPTLEQTLLMFMENDLSLNLELKVHSPEQAAPLVEEVAKVLAKTNFPSEKLIVSSFSELAISYCAVTMPNIRIGYITEHNPQPMFGKLKSINVYSIHVDCKILNQEMAKSITQGGFKLVTWTLNDPQKANIFRAWGVEIIITDKPDIFMKK